MASDFNPYHKWLGIPPSDQPPHHYRLLGVDPFEADPQVIESAADRQMTFLRTFQNGPNADLSQRLLNELAAAKLTLLRPEKKAAYDQALRARLAARQAAAPATGAAPRPMAPQAAASPQPAQPLVRAVPVAGSGPRPQAAAAQPAAATRPASQPEEVSWAVAEPAPRKRNARRQQKTSRLPLVLATAGVLGVIALVGVGFVVRSRPAPTLTQTQSAAVSATAKPVRSEEPAASGDEPKRSARAGSAEERPSQATAADERKAPRHSDDSDAPALSPQPDPPATVASSPAPGAVSAGTRTAIGEPIDLLTTIDLKRNARGGQWSRVGNDLISPSMEVGNWNPGMDGGPRVQIASAPQSPIYRLNLEVERIDSKGSLAVGLPVGDRNVIAMFDGMNHHFAFPLPAADKLMLSSAVFEFRPGTPAAISLLVMADLVRIEIDGKTLFTLGNLSRLGNWNAWAVTDARALFVGSYGGSFRFHKIELVNLDALPPAAPQAVAVAASVPPAGAVGSGAAGSAPSKAAAERPEAPSAKSRAEALAHIKEIYRNDYKDLTATGKTALATRFAAVADDTANSPAERYVLFEEAAALAAAGNDLPLAARTLNTLGQKFAVDVQPLKVQLAEQSIKQAVTNQQRGTLLTQLQSLADADVQDEHYAAAGEWLDLALELAKSTKNTKAAKQLKQTAADVKDLAKRSDEAAAARKELAEKPDASEAHLVLGRYLCFARDDWREGLPHLAKSGDKLLSETANRDLQTSTDTADQVALADAWFALGERTSYSAADRAAMHQRASTWYSKALPQLIAKDKARAQTRLSKYPLAGKGSSPAAAAEGPKVAANGVPMATPAMAMGPADPDLERRIAQWAIQVGNGSHANLVSATGGTYYRAGTVLPDGPFQITSLSFLNIQQGLGEEFNLLPKLPALRGLSIYTSGPPVGDEQVRTIGQLTNLQTLTVNSRFASPDLACNEIAKLGGLNSLSLSMSNISDANLRTLQGLSNLNSLTLSMNQLTDAGMSAIGRFSNLQTLSLGSNGITDAGLANLAGLTQLNSLHLDQTQVTDAGLKHLANMINLQTLGLTNTRVTGAGLKQVPGSALHMLMLGQTDISDADMRFLNAFTQLSYLSISNTRITDRGIQELTNLNQLRTLSAMSSQISVEGAQAFMNAHPNCKVHVQGLRQSQVVQPLQPLQPLQQ